jgi:hypothetical protein
MKIFISWSGERSQKIAELFKDWIQCVIQAAKPWISSHDVDRGALWYTETPSSVYFVSHLKIKLNRGFYLKQEP